MGRFVAQARRSVVRAVLLAVAAASALASAPVHAQGAWTCSGVGSALCATGLALGGCPSPNQVCDGSSSALSNTGASNGCVCLSPCTASDTCGTGEACIPELGNHCTGRFSCNSDAGCPADAKCTLGFCTKVTSCSDNFSCPRSAPDCVRGACTTLGPGQCTSNDQCNRDACAGPQRCDLATSRCEPTGPRPCAGISDAQCVASGNATRCMIPACTSDAQCAIDPCDGAPQRCNVATGRCLPAEKPCQGELCQRISNAPGLAVCVPLRPDPLAGARIPVERFDPDDFEIIWTTDPPIRPPRGRGYLLRTSMPAGALRDGARPDNLRVTIAGADRGLVIEGALAAPGKTAAWTRGTATGVWRWKRTAANGAIDSATLALQGARLRVEVRGRMLAGAPAPDPAKTALAARVAIDWTGAKPSVSETSAVIADCKTQSEGARSVVVCAGRAPPK